MRQTSAAENKDLKDCKDLKEDLTKPRRGYLVPGHLVVLKSLCPRGTNL